MTHRRMALVSVVAAVGIAACHDEPRDGGVVSTESILADSRVAADPSASTADFDLAQRIKRGIASNESMSVQARRVDVVARDGVVTLQGAVANEAEKASIEAVASRAGAARIESELTFTTSRSFADAE